ncbi:MAG: hypothetical protein GF421_08760 [Candidatus Aminicenantes bacterium]|nr:hypothetical protein [Candidatus Aminicenantes bacterium]
MRSANQTNLKSLMVLIVLFVVLSPLHSSAQKVSIQFDKYHGYTETVHYLERISKAFPDITELVEIGKSNMGRPIWVLVVSNMHNGVTLDRFVELRNMRKEGVNNVKPMKSYQGKPGHWICGSTHGNEFTGTEVCLYIIDRLITGYGSESEIKKLVDHHTFYICPVLNPDGVFNSVEKGKAQRANSQNKDDDRDGKTNEDGPDDLNGDGFITSFRYPDPQGRYVIDDQDSRLMTRLGDHEETDRMRYSVIREDTDNDKDGRRGEDPEDGVDINRNFPEGWFKENGLPGGQGKYPTSTPEAHAVAEFFTNHRNIIMAQFYHTSGGFTFRPMGTAPHTKMHPMDVAVFDLIMGKKYLEIIGDEIPEAWQNPESLDRFKTELKEKSKNKYAAMRGYELPRGWRVSYNESRDRRYSYGMATDWAYMQYGMYSITTELWNFRKDIPDFPEIKDTGRSSDSWRALLKYQDEKYDGKFFVPWKQYIHPELGEGEIGGWIPIYRNNAFPGKPLVQVCEKHWKFEHFRASLMPRIEITDVQTRVLFSTDNARTASVFRQGNHVSIEKGEPKGKFRIIEISATIENKGKLATHLARGSELSGNREDVVWLIGDRDKVTFIQGTPFQKLGVLAGTMDIPGYNERTTPSSPSSRSRAMRRFYRTQYYPREWRPESEEFQQEPEASRPKRNVKWLIKVQGNTPLKIIATSQKGGTQMAEVPIK